MNQYIVEFAMKTLKFNLIISADTQPSNANNGIYGQHTNDHNIGNNKIQNYPYALGMMLTVYP